MHTHRASASRSCAEVPSFRLIDIDSKMADFRALTLSFIPSFLHSFCHPPPLFHPTFSSSPLLIRPGHTYRPVFLSHLRYRTFLPPPSNHPHSIPLPLRFLSIPNSLRYYHPPLYCTVSQPSSYRGRGGARRNSGQDETRIISFTICLTRFCRSGKEAVSGLNEDGDRVDFWQFRVAGVNVFSILFSFDY